MNNSALEAQRARGAVRRAINRGALIRPDVCNRCGQSPGPAKDGRSQLHAHHHDYAKPLEVEWLCVPCHRKETPKPDWVKNRASLVAHPGEANGQSKLTYEKARLIRESPLSNRRLAELLGVDQKQIWRVRKGESWKLAAAKEKGQ